MDRFGARPPSRIEHRRHVQVGIRRSDPRQMNPFVGGPRMSCTGVDVGENGYRGDAQLPAGAGDAYRDLSTVGDQDLREHH